MARCAADPLFWFDNFAWSYDPRRPPYHIPLILWDDQREMVRSFLGYGEGSRDDSGALWPMLYEKSRDQGASVILTACPAWDWLFHVAADYGLMTRREADLDDGTKNSLAGKIDYVLSMLPRWMLRGYDERLHRRRRPTTFVHPITGSTIIGQTTTGDAFRGHRLKRVLVDEAAHIPQMDTILTSISGATDAPSMASSVRGKGGAFAQVAHSESVECRSFRDPDGHGWRKLRLHYSSDPRRDESWAEAKKATMTPEAWAQEYEIDYAASVPGRIWPEFDESRHIYNGHDEWMCEYGPGPFISQARLIEGWDFGSGESLTAVVWAYYLPSTDSLYLRDYRVWKEKRYDEIARDIAAAGYVCARNPGGISPDSRLGDVAGRARGSDQRSWIMNLRDEGIDIQGRMVRHQEALFDRMRIAFSKDRILLHPDCAVRHSRGLPTLAESISQYRRDIRQGEHIGDTPKPRKDQYSHLADALQYIAADIWPVAGKISFRGQD